MKIVQKNQETTSVSFHLLFREKRFPNYLTSENITLLPSYIIAISMCGNHKASLFPVSNHFVRIYSGLNSYFMGLWTLDILIFCNKIEGF